MITHRTLKGAVMKKFNLSLIVLISSLTSLNLNAASGRADYDLDDDGLIEINDLSDLNDIRNHLDGAALYTESTGCPVTGCNGFELTQNLDFDSNGDGVLDALDDYWNYSKGWAPIGGKGINPFTGIFEGNNFEIKNLMINITSGHYQSLFAFTQDASIRNLGMTGELGGIRTRGQNVGAIVGRMIDTNLTNVYSFLDVTSNDLVVGGLVGGASITSGGTSVLRGVFSNGHVQGGLRWSGGLVGRSSQTDVQIQAAYFAGRITSTGDIMGGISGDSNGTLSSSLMTGSITGAPTATQISPLNGINGTVTNSYWATDINGITTSISGGVGATQAELACPIAADNSTCAASTLYVGWSSELDDKGNPYWDFGSTTQLPALVINGRILRDSDNDGVIDTEDAFANHFAASVDSDNDGSPDRWNLDCDQACIDASGLAYDYLPQNAAASLDTDFDGFPDAWNTGCDLTCQTSSGLTLDTNLNDSDNDGLTNDVDQQDFNALNDGQPDADADSDGLLDITTLQQLNDVRYNLSGHGYQFRSNSPLNSSGCPSRLFNGQIETFCFGYELLNHLDFDSNSDGVLDVNDAYWNSGKGWAPIGDNGNNGFTGVFEGNAFEIRNLMINKLFEHYQSLFAYAVGADIRNLGMTGELGGINTRGQFVGAIVGRMIDTNLTNVYSYLDMTSTTSSVGGLVGSASTTTGGISQIRGAFSNGHVQGYKWIGGLIGQTSGNVRVQAGYFAGILYSIDDESGGLTGHNYGDTSSSLMVGAVSASPTATRIYPLNGVAGTVTNSYWAIDGVGLLTSDSGGSGASLAELSCPTTADDNTCAATPLYVGWSSELDSNNNPYWDFGSNTQLPALVINGRTFRDSDHDGQLDPQDAFPHIFAASRDSDNDGSPDSWHPDCDQACIDSSGLIYDSFPLDSAASIDTDQDGLPDTWNAACDINCQGNSNLILDSLLNDSDNDGLTNDVDQQDFNALNDGQPDADADSDGLIDITTLEQLDAIRFSLNGHGRQLTDTAQLDSSGCPARLVNGEIIAVCKGYELLNNLNFDTDGNGVLDESDTYWNNGAGWAPLPWSFTGVFEGNAFEIRNLMVNRPAISGNALFQRAYGATIQNLGLTGSLSRINGTSGSAALAGRIEDTTVINVYSTIDITGTNNVTGGLIGSAKGNSLLRGIFSNGNIQGTSYLGGLIGSEDSLGVQVQNGLFAGALSATGDNMGGVNGRPLGDLSFSLVTGTVSWADTATRVYPLGGNQGTITNSYWAIDTVGIATSTTGGVGATLAELVCPTAADNSTCAASPLYVGWSNELDDKGNPYWDFGNATQLPALVINGRIMRDSDADGVLDHFISDYVPVDAFPLNAAVSSDTDGDGLPDSWNTGCDATCQASSTLTLDSDDDGDGVDDSVDAFPLEFAVSIDTDGDGLADDWNVSCDSTCQANSTLTLDSDDDGDNITDSLDAFPLNIAVSVDTDGDGLADDWNTGCDSTCQINSTLTLDSDDDGDNVPDNLDVFPLNFAISVDTDGDGLADSWNTGCDIVCQNASGVAVDTDDDNDGVLDVNDPALGADNGLPIITNSLDTINISATGTSTQVLLNTNMVIAFDEVDNVLDLEVSLNNQLLVPNAQDEVALPSGALSLEWVAIDDAGNRSEPAIQLVNIYPLISFELSESATGEASEALLGIQLSGPSPVYPVNISVDWFDFASTADVGDVLASNEGGVDLTSLTISIDSAGELETAALMIPIIDDGVNELDETLEFEISSSSAGLNTPFTMPIDTANATHVLTITDTNLAPQVTLSVIQNGMETTTIDPGAGEVSVTANVMDANGSDVHNFVWFVTDLAVVVDDVASFNFDPLELADGTYGVSVNVSDDGYPILSSGEVSLVIDVKTPTPPASGGGGGGSLSYLFMLMMLIGGLSRRYYAR